MRVPEEIQKDLRVPDIRVTSMVYCISQWQQRMDATVYAGLAH